MKDTLVNKRTAGSRLDHATIKNIVACCFNVLEREIEVNCVL